MQFFLLLCFCIFGMLWYPSCAIVCLFTCLPFCLLALYVHLRACLIFCSHFMHWFMHFIVNMLTFCIFIFLQVLAGTTWVSLATSYCHNSILFVFRDCHPSVDKPWHMSRQCGNRRVVFNHASPLIVYDLHHLASCIFTLSWSRSSLSQSYL